MNLNLINGPSMLLMFFIRKIETICLYVYRNCVHLNDSLRCIAYWIHRIEINHLRFHHSIVRDILQMKRNTFQYIQYFIEIHFIYFKFIQHSKIAVGKLFAKMKMEWLTSISIGYCTSNRCLFDSECASILIQQFEYFCFLRKKIRHTNWFGLILLDIYWNNCLNCKIFKTFLQLTNVGLFEQRYRGYAICQETRQYENIQKHFATKLKRKKNNVKSNANVRRRIQCWNWWNSQWQ